jgi:starch synthase (maltosyl-transferring)
MKYLAKLGFSESYTYFTWKNTARELREWWAEFVDSPAREYYRGNLFANTPDILTEYLVHGGRPAFRIRLLLAATMSPLYGIYSGFELLENVQRPGSEEYIDNEKYELKVRDWFAPGNLNDEMRLLNAIRRTQPALQRFDNLTFIPSDRDQVLAYVKTSPGHQYDLIVAVTLNPHQTQETMVTVPLALLELPADQAYEVEDLLTGSRYWWRGARNYVRLDPTWQVGHVLRVVR